MVTLIIVDYCTIDKTIQYLKEFRQKLIEKDILHVVLVDNAEVGEKNLFLLDKLTGQVPILTNTDIGGKAVYRGDFEGVEYLYAAAWENLGYAKGNNLGAAVAEHFYPKDKYYLFSNNDLRLPQEFSMSVLSAPIEKYEDVAVVGPKLVGTDGLPHTPWKKTGAGKQLFLNYFDLLLPKFCKITKYITNLDIRERDESRRVYWVSGAFLLVEAEAFRKVNGFDEYTFLYGEEMIFAERLQKIYKCMYYEKQVLLVHEHGQTVKKAWKVLQGISFGFASSIYYFREYRRLPYIIEWLAKLHFGLFKLLFSFKKRLKGE